MPNPIIKPGILVSPVESGYVAYDPATDTLHQLNPFAALLAELCDGSRGVDEMRMLVAPLMQEGGTHEVDRWIDQGTKSGLLVWSDGPSEGLKQFSSAELYKLVEHLKDHGSIQTAYICAKRVVELEPEHWPAWYDLGDFCQCLGKREEAVAAFQKYSDGNPDDAEIQHLLIAMRDEPPPPRASDRTVQHIYKNFAQTYDTRMRDDLEYKGPERLLEAIKSAIGDARGLQVLDIGCGSGFAGVALKPMAARIIGVDISPDMIALASKREVYDWLEVAEITEWLEKSSERFDLISCVDCLIYFGDLKRITKAAAQRLKPGGIFALTTESGPTFPFRITDTGRYEHHPDHIRDAATAAGLSVAVLDQAFMRFEYGAEVIANYAVLAGGPAIGQRPSETKRSESLVA
jgi:predicted TPR repeat methyltransferase